jgi:cytochrome c553
MKKLIAGLMMAVGLTGMAQAQGDPAAGEALAEGCVACHGQGGSEPVAPNYPKIAALGENYLLKQLEDIKAGRRVVPEMTGILEPFSEEDLADLAAYFDNQEMAYEQADPDLVELGRSLYRGGNMASNVASCAACHGPAGEGIEAAAFPRLGGQKAAYIAKQLTDWQQGQRDNDPNAMMQDIASKLTEAEIEAVSSYISGLH